MINILQHSSSSYKPRTEINVKSSDVTIAIAVNFNSAGEILTKNLSIKHKKKYISIYPSVPLYPNIELLVSELNSIKLLIPEININIAGNGIYTLKGVMNQKYCDEYTYRLLKGVVEHPNLKNKIISIRSGGQTGFDEAGIKSGIKLGINTIALLPHGYLFRDIYGKDIKTTIEETTNRFYGR